MQKVIVKMTENNMVVEEDLQEYNLALNIDLNPMWEAIQAEAQRYEQSVYLYIQTDYIIPIKKKFFSFKSNNGELTSAGGVTDVVKLDEINENKQVIVNAVYAGTYDDSRVGEIVSSAKIWLCEINPYVAAQGDGQYEIISNEVKSASTDRRSRKKGIRGLFDFGFFKQHFFTK